MPWRRKRSSERRNPRNMEGTISLTNLHEGESGVVAYASGGFGLVRRLADMGLTPGAKIKVLRRGAFRGPLQIEVRGVALALGRGVASRVFVRPLKKGSND